MGGPRTPGRHRAHKTIAQPELEKLHRAWWSHGRAGTQRDLRQPPGRRSQQPRDFAPQVRQPVAGREHHGPAQGSVHNIRATGSAESYSVHYPDIIDNGIGDNLNRVTLGGSSSRLRRTASPSQPSRARSSPTRGEAVRGSVHRQGKPAEKIEVQRKGIPTFDRGGRGQRVPEPTCKTCGFAGILHPRSRTL